MKKTVIALALTAAICCPAQNLIKNGDFQKVGQDRKLTDWKYNTKEYSLVQSDRPGETGKKAVMVKLALPEGKKSCRSTMTQKITLRPGKYRLTFTAKVIGTGFANCDWSCFGKDKKRIKVPNSWTPVCSRPAWKTITHEMVIPEGTDYIRLSVTGYMSAAYKHTEGTMYFTGISLTPVDAAAEKK